MELTGDVGEDRLALRVGEGVADLCLDLGHGVDDEFAFESRNFATNALADLSSDLHGHDLRRLRDQRWRGHG